MGALHSLGPRALASQDMMHQVAADAVEKAIHPKQQSMERSSAEPAPAAVVVQAPSSGGSTGGVGGGAWILLKRSVENEWYTVSEDGVAC